MSDAFEDAVKTSEVNFLIGRNDLIEAMQRVAGFECGCKKFERDFFVDYAVSRKLTEGDVKLYQGEVESWNFLEELNGKYPAGLTEKDFPRVLTLQELEELSKDRGILDYFLYKFTYPTGSIWDKETYKMWDEVKKWLNFKAVGFGKMAAEIERMEHGGSYKRIDLYRLVVAEIVKRYKRDKAHGAKRSKEERTPLNDWARSFVSSLDISRRTFEFCGHEISFRRSHAKWEVAFALICGKCDKSGWVRLGAGQRIPAQSHQSGEECYFWDRVESGGNGRYRVTEKKQDRENNRGGDRRSAKARGKSAVA